MDESLNIMIVEDSGLTSSRLKKLLEELGHRVVAMARTGAEAVKIYPTVLPDLVTMDITMPDMDGIEATTRIRKLYPDARIMMVTSHGHQPKVIKAIAAGAKGYMLKPITEEKLRAQIAAIINRTT